MANANDFTLQKRDREIEERVKNTHSDSSNEMWQLVGSVTGS